MNVMLILITWLKVMSVRFYHCDITIFPFIIKKVFCGEYSDTV